MVGIDVGVGEKTESGERHGIRRRRAAAIKPISVEDIPGTALCHDRL
jgi:hypothetical protein